MMYHGGKARQAHLIAQAIRASAQGRTHYLEPFVGGGNVLVRTPTGWQRTASDLHLDLILMWQAVQQGWTPPTRVTEEEYRRQRRATPTALRGFTGYAASWGGKWFGGYGRHHKIDLAETNSRWLVDHRPYLQGVTFEACDYRTHSPDQHWVVYCDPPYRDTTGYLHGFDHDAFWRTMTRWVEAGAAVLVSEFAAPEHWINTRTRTRYIAEDKTSHTQEHLWRHQHEHQPWMDRSPT